MLGRMFVSRAGQKLEHALAAFGLEVKGRICADLGCNVGGFTDCLLQRGAVKVYSIDTGYGVLDYRLRKDPRVVVMERTNAMHVSLPEPVGFICIDVAWTRQRHILPAAGRLLAPGGEVVSLIKPHYEADPRQLRGGVLPAADLPAVLDQVRAEVAAADFAWLALTESPLKGSKGNTEFLVHLKPASESDRSDLG